MKVARAASMLFTSGMLVAIAAPTTSCGPTNECSPEAHGFDDAPLLGMRKLPGRGPIEAPCERPRVEVIASEADLKRFYDELGVAEVPAVDFTKERVIVREGSSHEGISWTVTQGDLGVIGLLACITDSVRHTCTDEVIAVPAMIARAESRTCSPVQCGNPIQPPSGRR